MNKHELIELVKNLLAEEDLSNRGGDLLVVKREYKYFSEKEEETFYDKQLTETFLALFDELAKKQPKLSQSSYDEKKEIIELTKKLLDRNDVLKASKDLDTYVDAFKKAGRCGTKEKDDELWAEFRAVKDQFYAKKKAYFEERDKANAKKKAQKEAIIEKAKALVNFKNIKEANEKMNALMEEWKVVGFAGKDSDEALWQAFSSVRKEFNQKKKEHHEEMLKLFEDRANKKEQLIKEAKALLADSDFSDEEVKRVKELRNKFNDIGFAGKDKDDDLYQRFDEVIRKYFDEKKFYTF